MLQNVNLPTYEPVPRFTPDFESLNRHRIPKWFMDAKLGIFIHWGPYSVPAWAPKQTLTGEYYNDTVGNHPYAEIYGYGMMYKDSQVWKHHVETYGKQFQYEDFFPLFRAEKWDPDQWAELFHSVGAKYSVLVTKHSDSYCMFDTKLTDRCSTKIGPMRDVTGEFVQAMRKKGLKAGLYYSTTFDWYYRNFPHVIYKQFTHGQFKELIDQYQPDILWSDDYWKPMEKSCALTWGSEEIISYYYNHVPDSSQVLTNDRWGCLPDGRQLGDFSTPEYTSMRRIQPFCWETNRGIGRSFGYNREEGDEDYIQVKDLVFMFVDIISKNGNLLLNLGPKADGTIPDLQLERLKAFGKWVTLNAEGIYETRPWVDADGTADFKYPVRFTRKGDAVYAFIFNDARNTICLDDLVCEQGTVVTRLDSGVVLSYKQAGKRLIVDIGEQSEYATAIKFSKEPYRLMKKRPETYDEGREGELFRKLGFWGVELGNG